MAELFPTSEIIAGGAFVVAFAGRLADWLKSWGQSESDKALDHKEVERLSKSIEETNKAFRQHEIECSAFRGTVSTDIAAIKESSGRTERAVAALTATRFSA